MPTSPAVRMISRAESAPRRWPSTRGKERDLAQRPLPSMITATCRGRFVAASALRWGDGALMRLGLHEDGLIASRSDRCDIQFRIGQFGDGLEIFARLGGQLLEGLAFLGGRAPAFKFHV